MGDLYLKIILIGDISVGKTNLLTKYTEQSFSKNNLSTIGIEFKEKVINFQNKKIALQIWDTSGQERYNSIVESFYKNSNGILFVFDVTNKDSLENIKRWLLNSEVVKSDAKKILVGNKIDLADQRVINKEEMEKFGQLENMDSFETSAKTGENVDKIFEELTKKILENKSEEEMNKLFSKNTQNLSILSEASTKKGIKKKCC